MKTKTLLLLASVVVLTTVARAAQTQTEPDAIQLPTYTVEAPRYSAAEKQINANLAEFRQQAKAPVAVPMNCPSLKAVVDGSANVALKAQLEKALCVAKS